MESQNVLIYKGLDSPAFERCRDVITALKVKCDVESDFDSLQQSFFKKKYDALFFFFNANEREKVKKFFASTRLIKESCMFVGVAEDKSLDRSEFDLFLHQADFLNCPSYSDFLEGFLRINIKAKGQSDYAAMLIHDLRSPFQSVLSYLELLQNEVFGTLNDGQNKLLDNAQRIADSMMDMIDELGDVLRYEERVFQLIRSTFPVKPLIHEVVQTLWVQADEKNLKVHFRFPETVESLAADRQGMSRVLTNLLSNAIQHSPAGSTITLSGKPVQVLGKAFFEISVTDQGNGLDPEVAKKVFSKYYRARKNERKGFGLGLYIARMLVEAHEGYIGVRDNEGGGSVFYFRLPVI